VRAKIGVDCVEHVPCCLISCFITENAALLQCLNNSYRWSD